MPRSRPPKMTLPVPSLLDATLEDLRDGLDAHLFTSSDLVEAYLSRIVDVNKHLGAVIELNPDAEAIAQRCDRERFESSYSYPSPSTSSSPSSSSSSYGPSTSPLHGIPLLLNDNIATADRMSTTAGSCVLRNLRPAEPSTIELRLRAAGAIVLGKTNMSEFAGLRGHNVPEGWSARGGQTLGAYFPRHNPRGSSSGAAVAASIGCAWAAVATDTHGGIVLPADANNVVGLRPTVGLVSRHMVIPVSRHLDTVGTLTRTVTDAAHLLAAIAGPDPRDEHTSLIPWAGNSGSKDNASKEKSRTINDGTSNNSTSTSTSISTSTSTSTSIPSIPSTSIPSIPSNTPDYVAACRPSSLRGKRIGVPHRCIAALSHRSKRAPSMPPGALDHALSILRAAGATIVDDDSSPGLDLPGPLAFLASTDTDTNTSSDIANNNSNNDTANYPLEAISFMADLPSRYLARTASNPDAIDSLERLLHLTRSSSSSPQERPHDRDTLAWQDALSRARRLPPSALSAEWERHFLARMCAFDGDDGIPGAMARLRLDAVLAPAAVAACLAGPAGLPVLSVPLGRFPEGTPVQGAPWAGLVDVAPNRPYGVSLVGAKFGEEGLLGIGYVLEQGAAARGAVRPLVRPGVDLEDVVARKLGVWEPEGDT